LLYLLSYGVGLTSAGFVIFSLANGLLWLAELIEEHSKFSKAIGIRLTYGIILLHLAIYFTETLPFHLLAFSSACHVIYLQNFSMTWPLISLTSPTFILSCIAVVADHFLWFSYFAQQAQQARQWHRGRFTPGASPDLVHHSFWETTSFFGTCVWMIPLFLFLSLSANDNALPFSVSAPGRENTSSSQTARAPRSSLFKRLFRLLPDALIPKYLKSKETVLPMLSPSTSISQPRADFFLQQPPTPTRSRLSQPLSPASDLSPLTRNQPPRAGSRRRSARLSPEPSDIPGL